MLPPSYFDEIPLWSAPFGLKLLENITLRKNINILDVGCGSGFPMIEIAERFGDHARVFGIDPSEEAVNSVKEKIARLGLRNISPQIGAAERLPFEDDFFHLLVSNNGLNNVEDQARAVAECFRVCRRGAQILFTVNLPDTMREFYDIYEQVLREKELLFEIERLHEHIFEKRKPIEFYTELFTNAGFTFISTATDAFTMRFIDSDALFEHHCIHGAFLPPWEKIISGEMWEEVFRALSLALDTHAESEGELRLTIPFACFEFVK